MKKQILTLLLLTCQLLAFADGNALLVTLKDGKQAGYVLSAKPTVTFSGTVLNIKVGDASTAYDLADVNTFTFVDEKKLTSIEAMPMGSSLFEYRNGIIRSAGADIQVFTLDGKLLKNGESTLSLAGYPKGVYIVKMNHQVIKIRK